MNFKNKYQHVLQVPSSSSPSNLLGTCCKHRRKDLWVLHLFEDS